MDDYKKKTSKWRTISILGRLVFHGKAHTASYFTQQEETKPYIEWFAKERIPKYLKYFESVLKHNNGGQGWDMLLFCLRGFDF